ncbi:hypothetical protein ACOMICROBIO_LKFPLAJE_04326 [Vibrio sp. B1FIG11]|nr:hypothetical protein ACOMICROBIO_LKFPLAJE_04326 [Vibrio sp. B1FIG11]
MINKNTNKQTNKQTVKEGCKHIIQHSISNQQPHLTSPCVKLRSSQSNELKGEELVLHSRIIQFTMQHHNALKIDSEYSLRLLQNDDGKALNSKQKRMPSPLITTSKCLANHVEKRWSWRGLQARSSTLGFKPTTPPNLPLCQTPKLSKQRAQRGGTGFVFADSSIHNATLQRAESRF